MTEEEAFALSDLNSRELELSLETPKLSYAQGNDNSEPLVLDSADFMFVPPTPVNNQDGKLFGLMLSHAHVCTTRT